MSRAAIVPALLLCGLIVPAPARPADPGAFAVRDRVRSYRAAHEAAIVGELAGLLSLPNVASDTPNIEKNAERIVAALRKRGVSTELLRVPGATPVVYGELAVPGATRTAILYAHYDGQPVVASQWAGDPWKPVWRDKALEEGGREVAPESVRPPINPEWRIYARSASDDKAPIVALLSALDALRAASLPLSVNLKFFLEGEEEAGSPHLPHFLEEHAARLKGDVWLLFDGPVHQTRRMQIYFGARGVTDAEITTYGASRSLHSGHYGNWAPNPVVELTQLVSSMRDTEGRIRIAGFSDEVRPLTETERRAVAQAPDVDAMLRGELGLARTEGAGESLLEALMRPALNLRGISGGDIGSRATNSIPTEATASIDFRLVPDQTPERVRVRVEEHIRGQGYTIVRETPDLETRSKSPRLARVVWGSGYPAARTSMDLPVSRAIARVVEEAAGSPIVQLPMLGGSIPMYLFTEKLKTPSVGIPIVNHDNNQHAANENLRLQNLWDGIETCAALLARLGHAWK
ncbi:MAG TPA: M20/M25/M40 family metallo-hydrolase [Thermoanaerobaculia bacterium]|jgi:acetylornithine deacetylase/succinyl-diaminopimelate desuccinylase-like protein